MIRKLLLPTALPLIFLWLAGCNVINPSEMTPTYIRVDSFTVTSNPDNAALGSLSHRVTNVWVYFNNNPVGVYDLPATFPVRADAAGKLTLLAGVDYDGLRGYEIAYPLYTADTFHLVPQPGVTVQHNALVTYAGGAKLHFNADFESGAKNKFELLAGDTGIVTTTAPGTVFEGAGSGAIYIPSNKDSAIAISADSFQAPANTEAFLEINYKGTMSLTIGMISTSSSGEINSQYLIAFKPRNTWGKAYVSIKDFVSMYQTNNYRILIGARKESGAVTGELFIDNVKVVSL